MEMTQSEKIIDRYDRGHLTIGEAVHTLIEQCNAEELLALPENWKSLVITVLEDAFNRTHSEWNRILFIQSWCGRGEPPSQEELRQKWRARIEELRKELGRDRPQMC